MKFGGIGSSKSFGAINTSFTVLLWILAIHFVDGVYLSPLVTLLLLALADKVNNMAYADFNDMVFQYIDY